MAHRFFGRIIPMMGYLLVCKWLMENLFRKTGMYLRCTHIPHIYIPQIWSNHNHFSGLQFWHEIWLMFKSPLCGSILILMCISTDYKHITSMVLLYMVLHGSHQYTPFMLALIYQHQPDPSWVMFLFISANPYFLHGHHGWLPMLHDFDPRSSRFAAWFPCWHAF